MAPPARIRINAQVPFPANVVGAGSVLVSKIFGIWTISLDLETLIDVIEPSITEIIDAYFADLSRSVQSVTAGSGVILTNTANLVVNRVAPATTNLTLPEAVSRNGKPLRIIDYSQSVINHTITLTPYQVSQKIMRQSSWSMYSNSASLVSMTLVPIVDPDDALNYVWIIAP